MEHEAAVTSRWSTILQGVPVKRENIRTSFYGEKNRGERTSVETNQVSRVLCWEFDSESVSEIKSYMWKRRRRRVETSDSCTGLKHKVREAEMEPEEQAATNRPSTSKSTNAAEQVQLYNVHGDVHIHQYPEHPPVDILTLAKELKNKLNDRAKEIIGETVLPIQLKCDITRVKLQISDVLRDHVIYGEDINWKEHMKYGPFQVSHTQDRIEIDELFYKAKETATQSAQLSKTYEAKEKNIRQHGNTITLIGQPGIGKTTTSKMVTTMIQPETEYMFYIFIKNVNFDKEVTPFQFLIDNSLSNWFHSDTEDKELMKALHNSENVVIVLDGLDEAAANFSETPKNCPLDRKSKPEEIIKNLFNSTLLPNAMKLVTSRPGQFYQIHPDCRPTFVLEVLGLDKEAIDELGKQICGERYPAIKKFLKERPNLSALCYVPVNCILIMACLFLSLAAGKQINSMTQVLTYTLTHYMTSEHLKVNMTEKEIRFELIKLSKLAFEGFIKHKLVFDIKDFKEVNIKEAMVNNFMHTYVDKASGIRIKILDKYKRSYFSHLMWQEFLTAVYMMLFIPYERFQNYHFIFENLQWEAVARFSFGICNPDLEFMFLPSEIRDFEKKKKMILDILSEKQIDPKIKNFNSLLGKVSGWMHELDDKEIIKQVEQCLPTDITMEVPSNPTQARDLAFAFKSCSTLHNLTVTADDVGAKSKTSTFLHCLQGSTNTKIRKLVLIGSELRNVAKYLVPHIPHIDELRLENCKQLNDCMRDLCTAINNRPNKIVLDISSEFDENAASCLGEFLHKVSLLRIKESTIFVQRRIILHEAVQKLSSELVVVGRQGKQNGAEWATSWRVDRRYRSEGVNTILQLQPGKIKKLELIGRKLEEVTEYLLPHIKHIDELRLVDCKQLNDCMRDLCTAINNRPNKMKLTIISYGKLDDHIPQCLTKCVGKISELDLCWNKLSPKGQLIMRDKINELPYPQIKLTVKSSGRIDDVVNLDDHTAQCLAGCVRKITKLNLNLSELSPEGQYMLQEAIQQLPSSQIKITVTSYRMLNHHTQKCIAGCIKKISKLDLNWSKLSPEGQCLLQKKIQKLPSSQIKLKVRSDGRLDDHAAQCLAGCVGKISELDLEWNKLSPDGQLMLQEAIKQLPSPQIKLTVRSDGRLDDHAAQCLAGCVGKISELYLNLNELLPEGQVLLQEAIQQLSSPQIKLTVRSDGILDDHAAQCLAGCVGKISELDLDWNKISLKGQLILHKEIQKLPCPQIKITVRSDRSLDDHTALCLAGCIGKISELVLDWNKLSQACQRMLQKAIQQLHSRHIKLTVRSFCMLDDHAVLCISGCVGKISELDLDWNKLSQECQCMLQKAIQQLTSPDIKLIVRSNGNLDDHAAKCLAGCVGKISILDFNLNKLSPTGLLMLQEAIQHLPSPQIKITMRSDGSLNDNTALCLAVCVGKISELDLDWNKLSQECQLMLQEAIQQLPSPQNFILKGLRIDYLKEWFEEYKSEITEPKKLCQYVCTRL